MSIIKTYSVGNGDTFYIYHESDNFTIIDCNLVEDRRKEIINEIIDKSKDKKITRFISTHPDDDHFHGIEVLDEKKPIINFYCVKNAAIKDHETDSFKHYQELRDGNKAFNLVKGCSRCWINKSNNERDSAGINILWPDIENIHYKKALYDAENGESPNNISIVACYSMKNSATFCWFGDLENSFMEDIYDDIDLRPSDIIFAPHHGRKSGHLPKSWLDDLKPKIIVVGEAPSKYLEYYNKFNTIKQNSAGDITFHCVGRKIHIYCSSSNYSEKFLDYHCMKNAFGGYYIGTLEI